MLTPSAARTTALTRATRIPAQRRTSIAIQRRSYAQAADVPGVNGKSSGSTSQQGGQQQWQRKQPLATAQTLTLFSETPQGLLIALRSTLQSMTSLSSRLGPAPNADTTSKKGHHDHVLLYALSKDLPSQYLSEAVSILRGPDPAPDAASSKSKRKDTSGMTAAQIAAAEAEAAKAQQSDNDAASKIARVGILSSPLPASLIRANAIEPGSPPIATPTLYSAALSLLPGVNAIPFRSTIPGRSEVAVGRWMDRKPSWQQGAERRADLLDDGNGALPGGSRDWRDIWGRENLEGKVPEGLETLNPNSAASFIFFSDTSPHGLMEGLATQFPASSVLGLTAPPTPFETGRDQTLLISLPQGTPSGVQPHSSIHTDGAVGVALIASNDARDADHLPIPSVKTDFEGLLPFGPRREITSAQGNIISSLDNANAAQQFLRDIQTREHPLDLEKPSSKPTSSSAQKEAEQMSELQARQIASKVKKEEDFFIAIYAESASGSSATSEPLMLAQILSGHPSRGTLSIDTQVELGPGPGQPQGTMKTYAQFYQIDPSFVSKSRSRKEGDQVKADIKLISPSAIEIPGPDPSVWVTPRFLFLSLPPSNEDLPKIDQVNNTDHNTNRKEGAKHQVMALPNLFIAASERGWIAGKGQKLSSPSSPSSSAAQDGNKAVEKKALLGLRKDGSSIVNCTVPLAKATLSLRASSPSS